MERVCEDAGTATEFAEHPLTLGPPTSKVEGARYLLEVRHSTFLYQVTHIDGTLGTSCRLISISEIWSKKYLANRLFLFPAKQFYIENHC